MIVFQHAAFSGLLPERFGRELADECVATGSNVWRFGCHIHLDGLFGISLGFEQCNSLSGKTSNVGFPIQGPGLGCPVWSRMFPHLYHGSFECLVRDGIHERQAPSDFGSDAAGHDVREVLLPLVHLYAGLSAGLCRSFCIGGPDACIGLFAGLSRLHSGDTDVPLRTVGN